jgi:hypothetical protein
MGLTNDLPLGGLAAVSAVTVVNEASPAIETATATATAATIRRMRRVMVSSLSNHPLTSVARGFAQSSEQSAGRIGPAEFELSGVTAGQLAVITISGDLSSGTKITGGILSSTNPPIQPDDAEHRQDDDHS